MMNPADEKAIRQGLEVAERQIAEIEARIAEIAALNERKALLDSYIQQARKLLGEGPHAVPAVQTQSRFAGIELAPADEGERPLWRDAEEVLRRAGHPMHVGDILRALVQGGRNLGAQHPTEVLRGAMNRKHEAFEPLSRGWYALRAWPAEMKKRMPVLARTADG